MKKLYLMAFIAVATVVMVGCKPDEPKPTDDLKVVLDKHELELSEGEQGKLRAEISPAKEGVEIRFRSENEEIATVDASGLVSGIAAGVVKVIASAEGAISDTCVVTIISSYDSYRIEDYGVFGLAADTLFTETDTVMALSFLDNQSVHVCLGMWPVLAWDGDVTYVSGIGFTGKGLLIYAMVPFYTINDEAAGDYNGIPFGWGTFAIADTQGQLYRNIGKAGSYDKDIYCEYMESYLNELIEGGTGDNIKWDLFFGGGAVDMDGAMIFTADHTEEESTWGIDYGLVDGIVKKLNIQYNGDDFTYEGDIDWFDNASEDTFYGLVCDEEGAVKPYELRVISEHYEGTVSYIEEAPAHHKASIIPKRYKEEPVIPAKVRQVLSNTKLRKL